MGTLGRRDVRMLLLAVLMVISANIQLVHTTEDCDDGPRTSITTSGGRTTYCFTDDGRPPPQLNDTKTGLDTCFNDDGSYNCTSCGNKKVMRILSRWFKRVPGAFKKNISETDFRRTHGLGWAAWKRRRALAIQVRQRIAELHGVDSKPVKEPDIFDDEVLSEEQLREWLNFLNNDTVQPRIVLQNTNHLWPKLPGWPNSRRIYFDFDDSWFDSQADVEAMAKVYKAMKNWESLSCYRFTHVSAFNPNPCITPPGYIMISRHAEGCWSKVGYRENGPQYLNLDHGCLSHGIIMHEFGHAIGVRHEQKRPDRDWYIDVFEENIKPDKLHNFKKLNWNMVDGFGVPYDYSSLWHYGTHAFTNNSLPTILPKKDAFKNNLGQLNYGPTFSDLKIVHKKGCLDPLVISFPWFSWTIPCEFILQSNGGYCLNSGYVNYKDCKTCICPWGLGQPHCDTVAPSSFVCTGAGQYVVPPGHFPVCVEVRGPGLTNAECSWLLKSGPGTQKIKLWFEDFSLSSCSNTFVEVRADTFSKRAPWYCSRQSPPIQYADRFLIHFRSRISGGGSTGFKMCWQRPFNFAPPIIRSINTTEQAP